MSRTTGPVLLSTAYLPPIQYISKLILSSEVLLEQHEKYQKQTYRNRCCIYGANGHQTLVVPVLKQKEGLITDVHIDHEKKWQQNHWKSIESAYRLSPYFEYYADDLSGFYKKKTDRLFEWNLELLRHIIELLCIQTPLGLTGSFQPPAEEDENDFRYSIHPKDRMNKPDHTFHPIKYQQVFIDKFGFIPNLSILDLVFNEGPHALEVVRNSIC